MGKNKTLALITFSESTKVELCSQLRFMLEGYMDVIGYATETGIHEKINADLIVMSSHMMAEQAADLVETGCPVIVANRSLNLQSLEKLFQIPKGTEVVVVNDEMENSVEVIKLLKEIGIDYIQYIPYAPGFPMMSRSNIAITPGEVDLVPSQFTSIINIGPRVIDLTTIIEILSLLNLLDEKSRLISVRYLETIIKLNKRLHDSMEEADRMNIYLNRVLNQVNEGILAFSDEGVVSVCNEAASALFGIRTGFAVDRPIAELVRDTAIMDFFTSKDNTHEVSDQIFKINNTEVIINRFHIDMLHSTVCTIKNTKETIDMEKKLRQNLVKKGYVGKYYFTDIICETQKMKHTVETAKKLADSDLGILIYGESGVGKELFASAIHNESRRNIGPFLAVNFSALPEDLVESELFGYEEGSFTGAKKGGQRGIFEQANGGTIFLDEIGDISLKIQARLLRVLQEKEIRRVGGTEIIPINVRVIAATNQNLAKMCQEKNFREDLYHRLKKLYLKIPPLRERPEDIDGLIKHFVRKNKKESLSISEEVKALLDTYAWPGNVRELENVIEYFLAVYEGDLITLDRMPQDFQETHHKEIGFWEKTDYLFQCGSPEEYQVLLSAIEKYNLSGIPAGRKKLLDSCSKALPYLTEDKIRRKTDCLKEAGLISKRPGMSGMRLTPLGIQYLRNQERSGGY